MKIPQDLNIGILGAGGKMGMRIGVNLKHLANKIFHIENGKDGMQRLSESGVEVSLLEDVIEQIDCLILAVPDIYVNKISIDVVPKMKSGAIVMLLDPAAAYMNQVCIREDLHYTVAHPCHPALFKEQPSFEAYNDHFGGILGRQDVVASHWKGDRDEFEIARHVAKEMFAPVDQVFEITLAQMAFLEPTVVEVCGMSLMSIFEELQTEMDKRDIPRDAAMSFLLGHINVALAIFLLKTNPLSDGAMIAMEYGREKIIHHDWKQVLTDESLHEVLAKMLKLEGGAD